MIICTQAIELIQTTNISLSGTSNKSSFMSVFMEVMDVMKTRPKGLWLRKTIDLLTLREP